ncbi:acyl carrier protein, partial [Streptomyces sp. NPDC001581]|uniref:acyl carrier protein n=1 Tax=Streptomyces sp. NPDC001581 TaxID=3154386 RepID=UPI00331D19EE
MSDRLTLEELAVLMKTAGITVDPTEMARRPDSAFDEYGLDSLGLLGIVGELATASPNIMPFLVPPYDSTSTPTVFVNVRIG